MLPDWKNKYSMCTMSKLPKAIGRLWAIPIKAPVEFFFFFYKYRTNNPKMCMKPQKTPNN